MIDNKIRITKNEFVLDLKDVVIDQIEDYQLFKMYKSDFIENDIFQVYEKTINDRIGWIFPIIALSSTSHEFADNPHFKRYAFMAYKILTSDSEDEFLDFHENLMILILCKSKLTRIQDFRMEDYLPSLFQYGYMTKDVSVTNNSFRIVTRNKVEIQCISDSLKKEDYPYELFKDLIFETHPLVKFHILYQNIELLISKILLNEINILSKNIELKKVYTRDIARKLENFVAENKRITKLFSDYCNPKGEFFELLKTECDNLLTKLGKSDETKSNIDRSLYAIRNFIVHDYRNISKTYHDDLKQLNCYFELFITDLLINYKQL